MGQPFSLNPTAEKSLNNHKINDIFETGFEKEKKDSTQPQHLPQLPACNKPDHNINAYWPLLPQSRGRIDPEKALCCLDQANRNFLLIISPVVLTTTFLSAVISRIQALTLPGVLQESARFQWHVESIDLRSVRGHPFYRRYATAPDRRKPGNRARKGRHQRRQRVCTVNQSLFDGGGEWYARADYLKKRMDYSFIYYRRTELGNVTNIGGTAIAYEGKSYISLSRPAIEAS